METKICNKCKEEKDICEFGIKRSDCKICRKKYSKEYYNNNKKSLIEKQLKYIHSNHNKVLEHKKEHYKTYKEKILKEKKEFYVKNRNSILEKRKDYRKDNYDKICEYKKTYFQKNKNKFNEYYKLKYKNDNLYKIGKIIRRRVFDYVTLNYEKEIKTFDIVGCSSEFLKEYLEQKFTEGMSWDLMGQHIHIDHIVPLSSANTEEEIYKLCHYTNLQPLWAEDNLKKGSKIL